MYLSSHEVHSGLVGVEHPRQYGASLHGSTLSGTPSASVSRVHTFLIRRKPGKHRRHTVEVCLLPTQLMQYGAASHLSMLSGTPSPSVSGAHKPCSGSMANSWAHERHAVAEKLLHLPQE